MLLTNMKRILTFITIAIAILTGLNYAHASIYGSSLVGWWTFDQGRMDPNVVDSSASNLPGSIVGAVSTSSLIVGGRIGQAYKETGHPVDFGSSSTLNPSTMTVTMWIKPTFGQDSGQYIFFSNGNYANAPIQLFRYLDNNTYCQQNGVGGAFFATTFVANQWTFLACTVSGTASPTLILYVNGVRKASGTSSNTRGAIGTTRVGDSDDALHGFSGVIDDTRVYNRVLTDSDIAQLYYQQKLFHIF